MLDDALFGGTTKILQQALDVRMMRNQLIASNIANAETPGYRGVDIDFERTMQNIAQRLDAEASMSDAAENLDEPEPLDLADLVIVTDDYPAVGSDSNSVSMEKELGKLQQNKVMYEVIAQLLGKRLHDLSEVITNRGNS